MPMHGYRAILEKEVIEAWRTYRIVLLSALFVGLGIAAPVLARYLPDLTAAFGPPGAEIEVTETGLPDVVDLLLGSLVQVGALASLLMTMGVVATEKARGTAALVLARPVGRAAFLWAKLVGLGMQFGLAIGLGVLATWLYSTLLFGPQPVLGWGQLALVVWLSTMVYVSITFLGSVVADSPLGAAAVGLTGIVVLTLASTVSSLGPWLPTGLTEVAKSLVLEEASTDLDPARTVAISIAVIVVSTLLAWWRFRRQEI